MIQNKCMEFYKNKILNPDSLRRGFNQASKPKTIYCIYRTSEYGFEFSLRSTLMAMVPRGRIQIANTKSIGLTESDVCTCGNEN